MEHATLRAIVDLVPGYAHRRRAGWTPPAHVTMPEYVLLRRVAIQFDDAPLAYAELLSRV